MSDGQPVDPAIGLLEFASISAGIVAGDAMVKASPIGSIYAGTVHPGKYLVLVSGDTASVDAALDAGRAASGGVLDETFLPDIHPAVTAAVTEGRRAAGLDGDALGIVETTTVAAVLRAADAGAKAAAVEIGAIRLADDLGGKSYVLFSGDIANVEASVGSAVEAVDAAVVRSDVIAQLHGEMLANLTSELLFNRRVALRPTERGA